jgi:hypothetical protein
MQDRQEKFSVVIAAVKHSTGFSDVTDNICVLAEL